ncbi:MAG: hypothetical protein IK088_04860 [Lachnospiraceae bacterium]|nr:hypothetical protein [Lachnospiraceae bacterium]
MKQKKDNRFFQFTDRYLFPVFGIAGLIVSLYAVWLQAGGISYATGSPVVSFGFLYIPFWLAALVYFGSLILGYAMIRYFRSETEKSKDINPLTPNDFLPTVRWNLVVILVAVFPCFFSNEVVWVLIGTGAMAFSASALLNFKFWLRQIAGE